MDNINPEDQAPLNISEYVFTLDGVTEATQAERDAFFKGFMAGLEFSETLK